MARHLCRAALALASCTAGSGCVSLRRPLPPGLSCQGQPAPAPAARLLLDVTYLDADGQRHSEQEIFDEAMALIRGARRLILADFFLYNEFQGNSRERHRALCGELTRALLEQKQRHPGLDIVVITDPINTAYGGTAAPHLDQLRAAGIPVVITNLDRLPDSVPLYSLPWRLLVKPFGQSRASGGWLPNPFGEGRIGLRAWLRLLNFKANHRKVLIADRDGRMLGLVASANPHDASSAHSNCALVFDGAAVLDLYNSERAVLAFSSTAPPPEWPPEIAAPAADAAAAAPTAQVLTEGKIREAVLEDLGQAGPGDRADLVMFYLSDRAVIAALKAAHRRGAQVRVLLDPNKDAFGRTKNGIPNRQVARELNAAGIPVRWMDTHGEQAHTKLLLLRAADGRRSLHLGSANFTRRNLADLNLETNVRVRGPADAAVFAEADAFVETAWNNTPGRHISVPYPAYADESRWRVILYRLMEATGLSTF